MAEPGREAGLPGPNSWPRPLEDLGASKADERIILLKDGALVADRSKNQALTSELLRETYATAVCVSEVDGYFHAQPGR